MKFFLTICLLLSFSLNSFCQHWQLSLSNDFKIAEDDFKNQTISHSVYHNNCFYTVTNSGVGMGKWLFTKLYDVKFSITVSKFDRDMNRIKEVEIEKGEKKFGPLVPELVFFNNKLFLAYFQSADNTSFNLYLSAIDEINLTLKEPKKICTIKQENVGLLEIESIIAGGLIYCSISPDDTKMLVACKSSPNKIQTLILDNNINIVRQASMSVRFSTFDIPSAVLTPDDKICLVLESDQETSIVCVSPDGRKTEVKYNALGNLNPYFTRAKLAKDGKSIYIFSTAVQSGQTDTWCNGFLFSKLDCNTFKLPKPLAYEFTPEFIEAVSQKGGGLKHKKEYLMYNFDPSLIELDNGNIAILGSPEMTNTSSSRSAPNMNNKTHIVATVTMNVGPVVAFFPDRSGKTFEHVIIPRRIVFSKSAGSGSGAIQMVQSPSLSHSSAGFIASDFGEEIVIVYNDNTDNLANGEDEKPVITKAAGDLALAEAVINKDKKLQYRKLISESQKGRATYFLGNSIPTSSSSIIFPIGKDGVGFNARKTFFTNWCFLNMR